MDKRIIAALVVVVVIVAAAAITVSNRRAAGPSVAAVTNFEECAAAGYPVAESYPEQCRTPDGRTFVRQIGGGQATGTPGVPAESEAPVRNVSVRPNDAVSSPLVVTGEARGTWFFEASLPIKIVDSSGRMIVQAPAQAEGEWMTTDYVPFKATLAFSRPGPSVTEGFLVIEKDNPSGLPENAAEVRIPVRFAKVAGGAQPSSCYVGGCSSQICSDQKDAMSTCEFRAEYSCYRQPFAKCERQANGQCGWTENRELSSCLANPPALE